MDPQHQRLLRAKEIFADTLERPDRAATLRTACAGDPELLALVTGLLDAHAAAARFMDSPSTAPEAATTIPAEPVEQRGVLIGSYTLLEQIGEGGFGVVFMAEQTSPIVRRVAVKVIKLGMDTRQVIARFEAERQALAMMDHPNIAKVLDAAATDAGRPYFVMELVRGDPITEYCDKNNLSTAERLDLFIQVCHAVQHAHQKGIIHRDIKPSNVLVTMIDGRPVPKVIDFGIAKAINQRLTDKTLLTAHRQLIGTPQYMSPEQAEMSGVDIDTRSDIYSLGALLYELLTGTTPFDPEQLRWAALAEIQRVIREEEPQKPSTRLSSLQTLANVAARRRTEPARLSAMVRGDLDWIAMKCLEKDRTHRYETANGLAMDVQRHLAGEPVVAAPPSRGYRVRKFVKRNRRVVGTAGAIALALTLGIVSTVVFAMREVEARVEAEEKRREAEQAIADADRSRKEAWQIAAFHGTMLSKIDIESMGSQLREDILAEADAQYVRSGIAPEEADRRRHVLETAIAGLNFTNPAVRSLEKNVLNPALGTLETEFGEQPTVQAGLYFTLATVLNDVGLVENALEVNQRALAIRKRVLGDEHVDTLLSINGVGFTLLKLGRLSEAEACLQDVLATMRRVLGDDHPMTLMALGNLGATLSLTPGRSVEAEACLRESLERRRRVHGEDGEQTISAITNLAVFLGQHGRMAEAEPFYRDSLERSRRVMGDTAPSTLTAINNMGMLLVTQGRLTEAETCLRQSLQGCRTVHGDDHPSTLTSAANVGLVLVRQGRFLDAEPFSRQALEGRRRVLGNGNAETADSMAQLGFVLLRQGKILDAERLLRESIECHRRTLSNDSEGTIESMNYLGYALQSQGRFAEAEQCFGEALERSRRVLGNANPTTLSLINNMAFILDHLERPAEAEPMYREALERRRLVLGEEHADTLTTLSNLATFLLERRSDLNEAEGQFREIVSKARRVWGNEDPRTLLAIGSLANVLWQLGNFAEAEAYLREGLETSRRVLGDDHPDTISRLGNVGQFYLDQGKVTEAAQFFDKQLEACRKRGAATPADRSVLATALLYVGRSLIHQKEYAEAELLLREAVEIRDQLFPEGHGESWRAHSVRGILGEALTGQGKFIEAEPLILKAAQAISTDPRVPKPTAALDLKHDAIERVVSMYEAWDKAEPGEGHAIKAREWLDRLTPPVSEPAPR